MSGPHSFFSKIDTWQKALAALVAAVALGVTAGITLVNFASLPASVAKNAERISRLEATEATAAADREEIRDGIDRLQCLWLADRRDTPIEECL